MKTALKTASLRPMLAATAGLAISAALLGLVLVTELGPAETTVATDHHLAASQAQIPHAVPRSASWDALYNLAASK